MKPGDQIGKARNARINQAVQHAEELLAILRSLQGRRKDQHVENKDGWFDARTSLESLTQCVHEANAYNNAVLDCSGSGRREPLTTTSGVGNDAVPASQSASGVEQSRHDG